MLSAASSSSTKGLSFKLGLESGPVAIITSHAKLDGDLALISDFFGRKAKPDYSTVLGYN
jgi:hypothetical protein